MDQSLRKAAQEGNISDLYKLINRDGNVLRRIDEVEFIDTPLHVAADAGCIEFAIEIMNLKPSFSRKRNPQGLTPLHLAVEKGHKELVLLLVQKAKDLVRIEGKKGETPLHYLITREENIQVLLLPIFLEVCPESIRDTTTENQTVLHIAVRNNKEEALKILCKMLIMKTDYYHDVVNHKDMNGDTALHIAARDNRPQMIELLLECKAEKHATNQADATPLDVAQQHNNRESISSLSGCLIPIVSTLIYKSRKQFVKYFTKASSTIFHDMDNISSEDRNALLVILGLLLTQTYQATLTPPAGIRRKEDDTACIRCKENDTAGIRHREDDIDEFSFLLFYVPTSAVFVVALFLTLGLLKPFPSGFRTALQILLAFLAICFNESISFLSRNSVIDVFSGLVFLLMMVMCFAYRVSKVSVLILGCWLLPMAFTNLIGNVLVACLSFLFLYDEYWKGSALVVVFSLITGWIYQDWIASSSTVLGCWFLLSVCRFCIKYFNERCSV